MKRSLITIIVAVAAGNAMITVIEKLAYSPKDMEALHQLLLQAGNHSISGALYPPGLLMQKMIAWAAAAFTAGMVIAALQPRHSRYVPGAAGLFFILAALVNVAIVPHPSWFAAAVPALFIVPLLGGLQAVSLTQQLVWLARHGGRQHEKFNDGIQTAAV